MKKCEKLLCSFENWFYSFENITIPSAVLSLSPDVLNYLQDDGTLTLPRECNNETDKDSDYEDNIDALPLVDLENFNKSIRKAIESLGGKVFPKLNWSSPKDAAWITFNKSLECHVPNDVYLLLKSSDFVSQDLMSPFKFCEDISNIEETCDYNLVLRQWVEINPSNEFRVFVKNKILVGISQREISQYFEYISSNHDEIMIDIINFWENSIKSEFPLNSYIFDVYREKKLQVLLIDFSPIEPNLEGLFTYEELISADFNPSEPEFRFISDSLGIQPNPHMKFGLPWDVVGLNSRDLNNLNKFIENKINEEIVVDDDTPEK